MKSLGGALVLLVLACAAPAKTTTFAQFGITLDVPAGWTETPDAARNTPPPAQFITGLVSADGQRNLTAIAIPISDRDREPRTHFLAGMQDSLKKQGFALSPLAPVAINGLDFDACTATPTGANVPLMQALCFLGNGRAFTMGATSHSGDPTQDAELQTLVHSFRFLTPPAAIVPAGIVRYLFFKAAKLALLLACPTIALVVIVIFLRRKK